MDQTIEALPAKVRAAEADEEYGEEEEIREEDWDDSAHAEGFARHNAQHGITYIYIYWVCPITCNSQ